jgi:hypothetical protein
MMELALALVPLIFKSIGVLGLTYALYAMQKSKRACTWPQVEGTLTDAFIEDERDSDGDRMFTAKAEYVYKVGALVFRSRRIAFGLHGWSFKWLVSGAFEDITRTQPRVTVYYNPTRPQEATLLHGVRRFHLAMLVFFIVWTYMVFMLVKPW